MPEQRNAAGEPEAALGHPTRVERLLLDMPTEAAVGTLKYFL
jgi:hypothetical protein